MSNDYADYRQEIVRIEKSHSRVTQKIRDSVCWKPHVIGPVLYTMGVVILMSILCNCTGNPEPQEIDASNYFQFHQSHSIPDTLRNLLVPNPNDFEVITEDTILFTTGYSNQLIRTTLSLEHYTQIGRRGVGPGEYGSPANLAIDKNLIFFSDNSSGLIKTLPLYTPSEANNIPSFAIPVTESGKKFDVHYPYVAVLNGRSPYVTLYRLKDQGEADIVHDFLEFESYNHMVTQHSRDGDILFDAEGYLYVIPAVPYVLSVYKFTEAGDAAQVDRVARYDLQQTDQFIPWTQHNLNKLRSFDTIQEQFEYLAKTASKVRNVALLNDQGKKYLFVEIFHPEAIKENKLIHQLVSLEDGRVLTTSADALLLQDASENFLYFYSTKREKGLSIDVY